MEGPVSLFGPLLRACIRDDYCDKRLSTLESAIFLALGLASSIVTTFALGYLGLSIQL